MNLDSVVGNVIKYNAILAAIHVRTVQEMSVIDVDRMIPNTPRLVTCQCIPAFWFLFVSAPAEHAPNRYRLHQKQENELVL